MLTGIALAAAIAAQSSSAVQWKPLNQAAPAPPSVSVPAQSTPTSTEPQGGLEQLNNDTIIALVRAGLGPEAIVAKIGASRGSFDTSTTALIALKNAGVPDSVIAAMLKGSNATVARNAVADNSNPDPLVPHAPGIYVLDSRGPGKMTRIDATVSNQLKTSNLWGYALTSGISSLKMKAVIPNATARVRVPGRRPAFFFYFNQSSFLSSFTDFSTSFTANATSPNEFSLIRFDSKKDRREASVASVNLFAGVKSGVSDKARIQFSYEDVAPGVFKVTPNADLLPGEYGFMYSVGAQAGTTARIFDFSVN